jgi:type II secretory pathway pseudopilin PulG
MTARSSPDLRSGFTIVETMVTIGIIVLLAGLLVPMIGNVRGEALSTRCLNNLRNLGSAVDSYRISNRDLLPMTEFLPVVTDEGPENGLPQLLAATIDENSDAWICPADVDDESLSTGTSYIFVPGLLRYSPQVQIPVAQSILPLLLDGSLTERQIERQRTNLEARLVTRFYDSGNDPRRFAILSDSQDRHPIGDRNPRNGLFRDGSVGAMPTTEEIADGGSEAVE